MSSAIRIRFATTDDEDAILDFLNEHWKRGHIFVTNPELMRWQHQSSVNPANQLSFVIAESDEQKKPAGLVALLGFIPFQRFDPESDWSELSLAIWKVRDDANAPGLGFQLLRYLERELEPTMICAIGISEIVKPIYRALGYQLGTLNHVALFPEKKNTPTLISKGVPNNAWSCSPDDSSLVLQALPASDPPNPSTIEALDRLGGYGLPRKSYKYIQQRYINHPWYDYHFRLAFVDNTPELLIVWRVISVNGSKVLRVVDLVGDQSILARCAPALRQEIQLSGSEYLDIVSQGLDIDSLRESGFVDTQQYPSMILPNYFSPFERRNVNRDFAYKKSKDFADQKVHLFRADSDQDRPNSPKELIAGGTKT